MHLMKTTLALLLALFSIMAHAETPSLSPEQFVRQIYKSYSTNEDPGYFRDLSDSSLLSARMKEAINEDDRYTLPGDSGSLDTDPLCACQDYENLVLEEINITQPDKTHAEAIVRFRPFFSEPAHVELTLLLAVENNRWVIEDVINGYNSTYNSLNNSNKRTEALLNAMQRERAQDYILTLFTKMNSLSWPWTGVVSPEFRRTVNKYQSASFDVQKEDYFSLVLKNPLCDCHRGDLEKIGDVSVILQEGNQVRVRALFSLINQQQKQQEFLLHREQKQWLIDDVISSENGSLRERMREVIDQAHKK